MRASGYGGEKKNQEEDCRIPSSETCSQSPRNPEMLSSSVKLQTNSDLGYEN